MEISPQHFLGLREIIKIEKGGAGNTTIVIYDITIERDHHEYTQRLKEAVSGPSEGVRMAESSYVWNSLP